MIPAGGAQTSLEQPGAEQGLGAARLPALAEATLIIDLKGQGAAHLEAATGTVSSALQAGLQRALLIVSRGTEAQWPPGCDAIEIEPGVDAVERMSLTLQLVDTPRAVMASTAISMTADALAEVSKLLEVGALVDISLPTEVAGYDEPPVMSSRTVVAGIEMSTYSLLRGLDLRLRTLRDAFSDYRRRVRSWCGGVVLYAPPGGVALEAPLVGESKPQTYRYQGAKGLFVNTPRWTHRPFAAEVPVTMIRFGPERVDHELDCLDAQTVDDATVIDACGAGEDWLAALEQAVAFAPDGIVCLVDGRASTPPWRLTMQLPQIRTGATYSLGSIATINRKRVSITEAPEIDLADLRSSPFLGTLTAPKGFVSAVLRGEAGTRRARLGLTKSVMSCGLPVELSDSQVATSLERARVAPFLGPLAQDSILVFDQYTVGRIDYIGAYDRILGIVTYCNETGKPIREMAAVRSPKRSDLRTLAGLGIQFELLACDAANGDPMGYLLDALLRRTLRTRANLTMREAFAGPGADAWVYVRQIGGTEGWVEVRNTDQGGDSKSAGLSFERLVREGELRWPTR